MGMTVFVIPPLLNCSRNDENQTSIHGWNLRPGGLETGTYHATNIQSYQYERTRNPNSPAAPFRAVAKFERDIRHLADRANETIFRMTAVEAFVRELAIRTLGDTPETAALCQRIDTCYKESLEQFLASRKANRN